MFYVHIIVTILAMFERNSYKKDCKVWPFVKQTEHLYYFALRVLACVEDLSTGLLRGKVYLHTPSLNDGLQRLDSLNDSIWKNTSFHGSLRTTKAEIYFS